MPRTAGELLSAGSPFALGSCSCVYGAGIGAEAETIAATDAAGKGGHVLCKCGGTRGVLHSE